MERVDEIVGVLHRKLGDKIKHMDVDQLVAGLDDNQVNELLSEILADEERAKYNKFAELFPDEGKFPRDKYPRHLEFFKAGRSFTERCFMAANRVGKTVAGSYEGTAHLTGDYPPWWVGRRFRRPIRMWAAGDTNETTRDIIQKELLGEVAWNGGRKGFDGTGMIREDLIGDITWKQGVQNLVDQCKIKHRLGWSTLGFKSFDQGRRVFQGTAQEVIWLDEECPEDVYGECLIRTMTTRGLVITTFTPLLGMSEVVLSFMDDSDMPDD